MATSRPPGANTGYWDAEGFACADPRRSGEADKAVPAPKRPRPSSRQGHQGPDKPK